MPKNYFTCANSADGFINFFPSTLKYMERVYIIKGGPGTGKSTMMKKVGAYFEEKGREVEYIHCSSDYESLDGVVLCDKKIAIVDGTSPHVIEPAAPGAIEEYLSLSDTWDSKALSAYKSEILALNLKISKCYEKLYESLRKAKEVHDSLEKIYIKNTDFEKLDRLADELIDEIFKDKKEASNGREIHRFFGALTAEGSVNYIENLTEDMETRYFIKGRAGTGKSTFLKKLAAAAKTYGEEAHIYHCSFDVNSLDMVIFPSLKISIFDSTAPHELFPSRESDIILDFYETAVTPRTDEVNETALSDLNSQYSGYLTEARGYLKNAHKLHDDLEEFYINSVDFNKIDAITKDLIECVK